MKILVACEESQAVTINLRKRGHIAFSCDLLPTSGPRQDWHIQKNVLDIIGQGWDMMIAFPPCTHLAVSGARWFEQKRKDGRQQEGIDFFMALARADIPRIAIENPIGIMSGIFRKPDQIIHPYYFGDSASKKTCLWLKNLPKLYHNPETHVYRGAFVTAPSGRKFPEWQWKTGGGCSIERSKTYPGIARAMAEQWTENINPNT